MPAYVYLVAGLLLLLLGGELLVRGATQIAERAKLSATVIGLTVVAWGTSMPEFVVSTQAAVAGSPDLAIGNVVGSNIFNVAAILGIAALLHPLAVQGSTVRMEWPVMFLASLQLHMLGRDGIIDRLEGAFLLAALIAFVAFSIYLARTASAQEQGQFERQLGSPQPAGWGAAILFTFAGIGGLVWGSELLVTGSVRIAQALNVSESVIGLTVVAAGTSLPELATSLVAAAKGRDDVAIANVIGSNIFNCLGIAGGTALIKPLAVNQIALERDNWWMLGLTLLLFPLMKSGMRVSRFEGSLLLLLFIAYWGILAQTLG